MAVSVEEREASRRPARKARNAGRKVMAAPASPPSWLRRHFLGLAPLLAAGMFFAALGALHHSLAAVSYGTIWRATLSLRAGQIALASLASVAAYLALSGYEAVGLRYAGHRLPYRRTLFASFIGFSFSNSAGFAMFTGASLRSRLYSAWGLSTPTIARLVAFITVTLWLGIAIIAGTAMLALPTEVAPLLHTPVWLTQLVGLGALALAGGYFGWCALRPQPLVVFGWRFDPPGLRLAFGQLAVALFDWLAAAAVLYFLLPSREGLTFTVFAALFVVAQGLGLASHVPGGLGVFESALLALTHQRLPADQLAAALLAFRGLYYVAPLLLATALLAGQQLYQERARVHRVSRSMVRAVPLVTPPAVALVVFATGAMLLVSGATPTVGWRLEALRDLVPLPLVETSHLVASIVGMALLILAHGLWRRVNGAWSLTVGLLVTAVVTSLLKGLDYEEAVLALLALACLLPARERFTRRSSLLEERWSRGWLLAVAATVAASTWLGFFAYRHVEYSNELWWQFEFGADAPRFLRATVGAVAVALALGLARLLRPARPAPVRATRIELERARDILRHQDHAEANLALLGDKRLLFAEGDTAFLMYAVRGRSWIVMGDPVGNPAAAEELLWQFRELCDAAGGWPVFYEVSRSWIPPLLEQGLSLVKMGEEARVPLSRFSLEGHARASLRRWRNAAERAGCRVEVYPEGVDPGLLPRLTVISHEWLAGKKTREKGFSLGAFDPLALTQGPVAIVWRDQAPVAFATLWTTDTRAEAMVDLMRYGDDAPPNVMSYLTTALILWAKGDDYRYLNLGMAPLAGLPTRTLAPLWARIGAFVFRHGESFYNFRGLREYKSRFDPEWSPRYLATPGGFTLPFILSDLATLIGGGLAGVLAK